jgi:hypothetical protein
MIQISTGVYVIWKKKTSIETILRSKDRNYIKERPGRLAS